MSGVDVIVAALAAGATAGTTNVATAAVQEIYATLREKLRRLLSGQTHVSLETDGTDLETLRTHLTEAGADRDEDIMATAHRLLEHVRTGPVILHVGTNYGAVAHTMTAPVAINYGRLPDPPTPPAAD
ncbi:hypothetical protein AB0368_35985 [Actinoplanes sp. NPDC051475]|uniref:hypothetical protein n=1 Tax=Actinoplanes sp. NPDC051475 TaxID=3157225 RepID=UPI00344D31B9